MGLDPHKLDALYARFGFELLSAPSSMVRAYGFTRGYFHNADVVPTVPSADVETVKAEVENLGYSARIQPSASLEEIEEALFRGFFSTEATRARLRRDYERFEQRLSGSLGGKYTYIAGRYVVDEPPDSPTDPNLIHRIDKLLEAPGPRLIVVEAAAGFGKTCTAYEVLRRVAIGASNRLPILTELSRNRQAKIFRYVLLDELDRNFPGINSSVVTHYIQSGRIPVIIDGFDELLHDSTDASARPVDDAETMLETIRSLIGGNAKILLTTRKTAFLSSDQFHSWLEQHGSTFSIHRFRLEPPTPADWLGHERVAISEALGAPIEKLANPVLLTFLRHQGDEDFAASCREPGAIADRYFSTLLDRERNRQDLMMSFTEQMSVFRNLAEEMLDADITSEAREYVALRMQASCANLLNTIRERYAGDSRPTIEELTNKLVNHALLDRFGPTGDSIGFVNDFVLGSLVGDVLKDLRTSDWVGSERFVDLATTAYWSRSSEDRLALYTALHGMLELVDADLAIQVQLRLLGEVQRSFRATPLVGHDFRVGLLADGYRLEDCVLSDCRFLGVEIPLDRLAGSSFINCEFYSCTFSGLLEDGEGYAITSFHGCVGDEEFERLQRTLQIGDGERLKEEIDPAERAVLERFWPPGRPHFTDRKAVRTLYLGLSGGRDERRAIDVAIKRLESRGVLTLVRGQALLNVDYIPEIRRILERS